MNRINYLRLASIKYNEELSRDIIKCSIVDLYTRCAIGNPQILRMLKGSLDTDGSVICADGRVRISPQMLYSPRLPENAFLASFEKGPKWQPECMPMITAKAPAMYGNTEQIITSVPNLQAKFPFIRLARCSIGESSDVNGPFTMADLACGKYLYDKLELEKWSDRDGNASWKRAFIDPGEHGDVGASLLAYYNSSGLFDHRAEFLYWNGQLVFLHLAYYQHPHAFYPLRLYIPPDKPIFFNENMLSFYQEATVILTDNPGLIFHNQAIHELIVLGVFGGDDEIEKIDLEVLRGRRIVWPIIDDGISDLKKLYQRAVKLKERFRKADIALTIVIYSNISWNFQVLTSGISYSIGYASSFWIFDDIEFVKQAQELGVFIPECLRYDQFGAIDISSIQLEPKELISKLVSCGTVTVINEFSRVRPFRISHVVLDGVIGGYDIFRDRIQNTQQLRVMVFLSPSTEQRFLRECQTANTGGWKLYKFPQESPEESSRQIKGALSEFRSDIVIFEAEEIVSRAQAAKDAIRLCIQDERGVIVVCHQIERTKAVPAWIESEADRILNVIPIPGSEERYVIENRLLGSAKPERFKVEFTEDGVNASDVTDEELMAIENRPLHESAQGSSMELGNFLDGTQEELLSVINNNKI